MISVEYQTIIFHARELCNIGNYVHGCRLVGLALPARQYWLSGRMVVCYGPVQEVGVHF